MVGLIMKTATESPVVWVVYTLWIHWIEDNPCPEQNRARQFEISLYYDVQ